MKTFVQRIVTSGLVWSKTHVKTTIIIGIVLVVGGYMMIRPAATDQAQSFSVVQAIGRGEVSSGIETTGEIVAAQKLDLDVYKQLSRIDVVNIQNGRHVNKGDVLISFDKSDANVSARSSAVSVAEAELNLDVAEANKSDPNTQIRTLENQIAGYKKSITDAYHDFLNESLEVKPSRNLTYLLDGTVPTLSGRYVGGIEGEYVIEVYASQAASGYSFWVSGIENASGTVVPQKAVALGTKGLKITFPTTVRAGDRWVVRIPNTDIGTYAEAQADYEKTVADIQVNLANAEQDLADLKQTDSGAYRDLNVEQASLTLAKARQQLAENYDAIRERDIVAPFAGSVQDMQNVVVGATPTGGTEDSISLGTLVSDEYLVTFTLDAADAAKVSVGQKVEVKVTSYAAQPVFTATITEVSSLPASSGVAQYDVSAKLDYDAQTAQTLLREGMLADVLVVQEAKQDVLRVPTAAISYVDGHPTVQVVDTLTEAQEKQFEHMGIVRTDGTTIATYPVTVELGVAGRFYTEIVSGLKEGDRIVTTATTLSANTGATVQQGFGIPGARANVRVQSGSGNNFQNRSTNTNS